MRLLSAFALLSLVAAAAVLGCDDKKDAGGAAASSSAAAAAKAAESAIVAANASAAAAAAASGTSAPAPAASASATTSMITGDAKDVVVTVKEPAKEPEKTVPATSGGASPSFCPTFLGPWSVGEADKSLGKAKEEVIPGFAPGTNGHQFKWTTTAMKPGKHKAQLVNKKAGDKAAKPTSTFTLTIDLS